MELFQARELHFQLRWRDERRFLLHRLRHVLQALAPPLGSLSGFLLPAGGQTLGLLDQLQAQAWSAGDPVAGD